jgi:hypothetical protein
MQWDKNSIRKPSVFVCVPYKMKGKVLSCARWYNSHIYGRYVSATHIKQIEHSSTNYGQLTGSHFAACGDFWK